MAVSTAKFIEQLSSVSLLASAEVNTLREKLDPAQLQADAEQLAKELVKSGKLTKFQAAALYQGKGKGLVFGEYVVLDKLGAGGMGQVFKAHHRRMKRLAAVKVLPPHIMKDPQAVQRFYQEVEMAAKLSHQNIVAAYDAAETNGLHYLVMEFVDGRDLSSLLQKQGPLNVDQVMNVIRQTAEGLAYAHSQGVVHRDIKPGNLLIDKAGIVKILDMGLARTVDALEQQDKSSKQELTQAGQVMGTVDYMAPEQARDARTADHRADIYSLGCTMYRLLTGYVPFPADTMVKKLMAHVQQPVPSLKKHCPEATPQLEELFRCMLEKDPAKRIGSAKEVAETLKKLLSGADEERSSVSVLDDPEQAEEWQSFLKTSGSSVSGLGKAAGSTVGKAGESAIGKSNVGRRGGSTIGKSGGSIVGKKEASVSEVIAETSQNKKLLLYGGIATAAILLLALGGWLAIRGDAEQEPLPANTVAAVPTPSKPAAPVIALPTASAKPVVQPSPINAVLPTASPSPTATPNAVPTASPSATEAAFNLPATPLASATPSSTAPLFGLDTTKPIPTGTPSATTNVAQSGTATIVTTTATAPPPESGENYALYFDGQTSTVRVTPLPPFTNVLTWEATIWPDESYLKPDKSGSVMGDRANDSGTSLGISGTGLSLALGSTKNGMMSTASDPIPVRFQPEYRLQIAVVVAAQDWSLFVNGKLVSKRKLPAERVPPKEVVFRIGGQGGGGPGAYGAFQGRIDEVRLSTIVRYSTDYVPVERLESDEHTVALYHFNEGAGAILGDHSGHGRHGRVIDAQWVKAPPADPRILPPDSSTLIRVLAEVDKAIQPDLLKAKTPLDKSLVAQRLLIEAADVTKPGEARFARVQRALEIAVESGERATIDQVVAAQEKDFQGSAEERLADALTAVAKKNLTAPVWQSLAALTYQGWDRNYAADRIALARRYADAFTIIARKANNPALTKGANDLTKRLGSLKQSLDAAEAAQEKIAADANAADAHLTLGQYLCFDKEDWFPGLEHLTKGTDDTLRALAEQSLAAGDDLAKTLAVGDAWYDASMKATGKAKSLCQSAAVFWYLEAYGLLAAADRSRVEQRLTLLGTKTRPMSFTQARRERAAAEWVLENQGSVGVVPQDSRIEQTTGDVNGLPHGPFWVSTLKVNSTVASPMMGVERLKPLKAMKTLWIGFTLPTGSGAALGRLTSLTELRLQGRVNEEDLRQLSTLRNMTAFSSSNNTDLTDSMMKLFEGFPNLSELSIGFSSTVCYYGDGGMAAIANLKNLTTLDINKSNVTDAGLKQLLKLTRLTTLRAVGSKVTAAGVADFKRALPNCAITGP